MPRETRHDARYLPKPAVDRGRNRRHGGDEIMTRVGPIGRPGRYTATHFLGVIRANAAKTSDV